MQKPLLMAMAVMAAAVAVIYLVSQSNVSTLNFFIDSRSNPLNGDVWLNGGHLGQTKDGSISTARSNVLPGRLEFRGEYRGREFMFTFNIEESQAGLPSIDFRINNEQMDSMTMLFSVNDTGEELDGDVYLNSRKLGTTENGKLTTYVDDLFPGTITLNGTYAGKPFEFQFYFTKESLALYTQNFVVPEEQMKEFMFNASLLDFREIELETFRLVNMERETLGSYAFRLNQRLSEVARNYSRMMQLSGDFSHIDQNGKTVNERLNDEGIFRRVANENLASTGYLPAGTDEADVAERFVSGWMGSPGHRSTIIDRDKLYSDVGSGVWCGERDCYATMIFAGMKSSSASTMDANSCWLYDIYDPSYNFDFSASAGVSVNASPGIDIYLVADGDSAMEKCISSTPISYVEKFIGSTGFSEKITAEKGYGLLFSTGSSESAISVAADYGQ